MKIKNQFIILFAIFLFPFLIAKSGFGERGDSGSITQKPVSAKDIQGMIEKFQSDEVIRFVMDVTNPNQGMDQFYFPPQEYRGVVDAGKPMVPYLLGLLSNQDAGIRLSAYLALCDITNQNFGNRKIFFDGKNFTGSIQRNLYNKKWEDWWAKNKTKTRVQWLLADIHEIDIEGIYKNKYPMTHERFSEIDSQRFLKQLLPKDSTIYKLGEHGDETAIPELRKLLKALKYLHTDNWIVQSAFDRAAESLQKLGDRCVIPDLIDILLRNDMEGFRKDGHEQIEKLAGVKFSFDPHASQEKREESISKIEKWWEENKDKICK